jgi:hypothetical protein
VYGDGVIVGSFSPLVGSPAAPVALSSLVQNRITVIIGRLLIFRSEVPVRDGTGSVPIWCISLAQTSCESKGDYELMITTRHRKFDLQLPSKSERDNWVTAINNAIQQGLITKPVKQSTVETKTLAAAAGIAPKSSAPDIPTPTSVPPHLQPSRNSLPIPPSGPLLPVTPLLPSVPAGVDEKTVSMDGVLIYDIDPQSEEFFAIEKDFKASLSNVGAS